MKDIFTKSDKEGYDYPKPNVPFDLPRTKTNIKEDPVVTIPSTYLPPIVETSTTPRPTTTTTTRRWIFFKIIKFKINSNYLKRTTTTRKTTTVPSTTPSLRTPTKDGYKYPKPETRFDLPNESVRFNSEELELPVTYLPPVIETTPSTTTTR